MGCASSVVRQEKVTTHLASHLKQVLLNADDPAAPWRNADLLAAFEEKERRRGEGQPQ